MIEWFEMILHGLRHPPIITTSPKEWRLRKGLIKLLREGGFTVDDTPPNPGRLYAFKQSEEFSIDIMEDSVLADPIKRVTGFTTEPIIFTDIPSSGRYGVYNRESKHWPEVKSIIEKLRKMSDSSGKKRLAGRRR